MNTFPSIENYQDLRKCLHLLAKILNFELSISQNRDTLGAIQKVCHRPRGGGGSSKIVTKSDKGGGVKQNSDVTAYQFLKKNF